MKTPSQIVESPLLEILNDIFLGEFPEDRDPEIEIKPDEIERAKITFPLARRAYAAADILADGLIALDKEHAKAHEEAARCHHTKIDCESFKIRHDTISHRMNAVRGLFWHAVAQEHPAVFESSVTVRKGMILASAIGQEWNTEVNVYNGPIISTFTAHISDIIGSKNGASETMPNNNVGEDETVVSTLEDQRVRSLWQLQKQIVAELKSRMPEGIDLNKEEVPVEWIHEHTPRQLEEVVGLIKRYQKFSDVVNNMFWTALRDSVAGGHSIANIGIRKDWTVVSIPPEHDEQDGIQFVNLGNGMTAIGVPVSGSQLARILAPSLAAALAGRSKTKSE